MPKSPRRTEKSPADEWLAYLSLAALVAFIVVAGVLEYSLLLALGSAVFIGFFGWLWWSRRRAATAPRKSPPRRTPAKKRRR